MKQIREEVCLYYMGFGLCAKGLHAEEKGCCACCSHYQASGSLAAGKKAAGSHAAGIRTALQRKGPDGRGLQQIQEKRGISSPVQRKEGAG